MRWALPQPEPADPWHRWFAWHPVTIGSTRVWWEWVERKVSCIGGGYDGSRVYETSYRLPGETSGRGAA